MKSNGARTVFNRKSPGITLIFGICCVAFYFAGSILSKNNGGHFQLVGYFCPVFGEGFLPENTLYGWLYVFFPVFVAYLCGFSYLGSLYCGLTVSFRSYLSGYSCFALLPMCMRLGFGSLLFVLYTLCECMIMLIIVSQSVEQKRFRVCYTAASFSPFKISVGKLYFKNFIFRVGVLFGIYVFRSLICSLIL